MPPARLPARVALVAKALAPLAAGLCVADPAVSAAGLLRGAPGEALGDLGPSRAATRVDVFVYTHEEDAILIVGPRHVLGRDSGGRRRVRGGHVARRVGGGRRRHHKCCYFS
eukprot:scaffold20636_cov73-Phaeocystis_antarctica.AAC.5